MVDEKQAIANDRRWGIICANPRCGHTAYNHDSVTTGGCVLRDCPCQGFQDPNSLGRRVRRALRRP